LDPYTGLRDPAPDPALFVSGFKMQQKIRFVPSICLLLTVGTFTSVFKDNNSLRSQITVEIKVSLVA
jgi:hypothetical protein